MREIDPIREPSEALLSSALHRLASSAEHNTPAALQASLLGEFRRHHRRRRQKRFLTMAAVTVCLLAFAAMLNLRAPDGHSDVAKVGKPQAQQVADVAAESRAAAAVASGHASAPRRGNSTIRTAAGAASSEPGGFIALPGYDPAMASGELEVVRVKLASSELRMLGAPVVGDWSDQPVLADFITDRDGTPYAVRLVQ
jgi:hypothetical protein